MLISSLLVVLQPLMANNQQSPYTIKKDGEKYGLVNARGKQILPARYDSLLYTQHQEQFIAYLQKNSANTKVGLINNKGKELIPISYQRIIPVALTHYAVANAEYKIALFNDEGESLTPFSFDEITSFKGKLARFYQDGKAGLLTINGQILIPAQYKDLIIRNDSTIDVIELRKWQVFSPDNKLLNEFHYDSIKPLGANRWAVTTRFYDAAGRATDMSALTDAHGTKLKEYAPINYFGYKYSVCIIKERNRYGLLDTLGQQVLPTEWDSLRVVQNTVVAGMHLNRRWRWHYFDLKGKSLNAATFQQIVAVDSGLIPVKLNGKWGYLNNNGKEVLVCRYDSTLAFNGSYAQVYLDGKQGLINKDGRWQIRPYAEHIAQLTPTRFLIRKENGYQLTDETGLILFDTPHTLVWLNGNLAEVDQHQQWGLISLNGKRISTAGEYQKISQLLHGSAHIAQRLGKPGILHADGRTFVAAGEDTFDKIYGYKEDYFAISKQGQQGFVDINGKLRIANRYDSVTYFSEGMAAVQIRGKWGYVDKIERLRVQPMLQEANAFFSEVAIVKYNEKFGLLSPDGNWILKAEYDDILRLANGTFVLKQNKLLGLADEKGRKLITPKYEVITDLGNNYLLIERDGNKGLIKKNGVSTIPLAYQVLVYDKQNNIFLATQAANQIRRVVLPKPL